MALEVDFVTLGDASTRLDVPPPTLRNWTDQLETLDVHYIKRNSRNERMYYENDIEVFAFLRDYKEEYGRKTTTKDLAKMIAEMHKRGERFELRSRVDAPVSEPSNKTMDLLNQEDIKRLMDSERVKQFMEIVVTETTKNIRDSLTEEFKQSFDNVNVEILKSYERLEKEQKEREERWEKRQIERDEKLMQSLNQTMENKKKKGFIAKLLGM